jgi:hypothetical protein
MRKTNRRKTTRAKTKLGLPDLEQAKSAVLASLRSPESQRTGICPGRRLSRYPDGIQMAVCCGRRPEYGFSEQP